MKKVVALALAAAAMLAVLVPARAQNADWYVGKGITDVTFVGLDTINVAELRPIVRAYIGKPFTMDLFWEMQAKLYELDYFESVDAEAKPADSTRTSVIVEFRVKERATVSQIKVTGNSRVSRSSILDKVLLKKGSFASQADVNLDVENIKGLYMEKGFPQVKITAETEREQGKNAVIVTFKIDEGQETKVKEIAFSGNAAIPSSALKGEMKTKEQGLFSSGAFRESQLQEDIRAIETYYHNRGYVDAKVAKVDRRAEAEDEDSRVRLSLTFFVEEGSQWQYGGMTYSGNKILTNAQIDELLKLKPGSVSSSSIWALVRILLPL
jgi:outer membrane protein insertion porin family